MAIAQEGGMTAQAPQTRARGPIKSPFDLAGGLFLIGLAALGLAGGFNLPTGTLSGIGSGFMPRVVAILVGAFGVARRAGVPARGRSPGKVALARTGVRFGRGSRLPC
jgi:hypothetical protein